MFDPGFWFTFLLGVFFGLCWGITASFLFFSFLLVRS